MTMTPEEIAHMVMRAWESDPSVPLELRIADLIRAAAGAPRSPSGLAPAPVPPELFIRSYPGLAGATLDIYYESEDARRWIEREGPRFGTLVPPAPMAERHLLLVHPALSAAEVQAYLETYSERGHERGRADEG